MELREPPRTNVATKDALVRWLLASNLRSMLSAPFIYSMFVPLAVLDAWLWMYQAVCWRNGIIPLANSKATAQSLGDWPVRPTVMYLGVDANRNPE